jgi:hypothetical protein
MTLECEVDSQESDVESWALQPDGIHLQSVAVKLLASSDEEIKVEVLGVRNLAMVKTLISTITLSLVDKNGYEIANSENPASLEWNVLEPREISQVLV